MTVIISCTMLSRSAAGSSITINFRWLSYLAPRVALREQFLFLGALPSTSWKNGGGFTREIAVWPVGASLDHFDWRVSVATISSAGPFSTFPGIDRVIMLLGGDGVKLSSDRFVHWLDIPHVPFRFAGDLPIDCCMLGEKSTDFNVMTRSARLKSEVRVLHQQARVEASAGVLMSLSGRWNVEGRSLERDEGLWWAEEVRALNLEVESEAPASLVCVTWSLV